MSHLALVTTDRPEGLRESVRGRPVGIGRGAQRAPGRSSGGAKITREAYFMTCQSLNDDVS
eukprot:scaffold29451_cov38-Cyclotella_meneghiniana.AAC.4